MKRCLINITKGAIALTVLGLVYLSSLYSYLLFHTVAEVFTTCIAFSVFIIAWNARNYIRNNYLIAVGTAYFFIGSMNLLHTLSYKGMQIFANFEYYTNQIWIAAHLFGNIVLLAAFLSVRSKKKANTQVLFIIYSAASALLMLPVFAWRILPGYLAAGAGYISFKRFSGMILCLILLSAIFVLIKNRDAFEGPVYRCLLLSLGCAVISELAFALYIDDYGLANMLGHYFKIFSFYFIYKIILVKGIQEPYDIIFREMKQTEIKLSEQNEVLKNQAVIDGLTGLYNHRHIYERLEEETKRCSRKQCSFAAMIIDIDHFKNINDTWGHLTGDSILKELSVILKENTRQSDLVGRYGGEEFVIMLAETRLPQGFEVAEKIRRIIEEGVFVNNIRLTVSIGIEEYRGEKVSELLEKADEKLYRAKNSGRNKTVM